MRERQRRHIGTDEADLPIAARKEAVECLLHPGAEVLTLLVEDEASMKRCRLVFGQRGTEPCFNLAWDGSLGEDDQGCRSLLSWPRRRPAHRFISPCRKNVEIDAGSPRSSTGSAGSTSTELCGWGRSAPIGERTSPRTLSVGRG